MSAASISASTAPEFEFATLEQAAEWFAVLRSGSVSDEERRLWNTWLETREENRLAWQRVEAISDGLSLPKVEPEAANAALSAAVRQRRRTLKMLSLFAVTGLAGWSASRTTGMQTLLADLSADHRSAVGQILNLTLADGTQIWLNTNSAVDEDYDEHIRSVKLRKGEVMIATHPDDRFPARPFFVYSAEGSLQALGTRFNVRQFEGKTRISVFEGRVEIIPIDANGVAGIIEAGEEAEFTRNEIKMVAPDSSSQAWSRGLLSADNMRLDIFIEELARYRHGYLACDPSIAHLRVVGGFPLNQPDQALAMLEAALPVKIHATLPWWITVRAR